MEWLVEAPGFGPANRSDKFEGLQPRPGRKPNLISRVSRWAEARRFHRHTATVKLVSVLVTGRYIVSRSIGSRPASLINRTSS